MTSSPRGKILGLRASSAAIVAVAMLGLAACNSGMTPAEHRSAACDSFFEIIQKAARGVVEQDRSILDDAVENARASESGEFEAAFTRWERGIDAGSRSRTDAATVDIADLCRR